MPRPRASLSHGPTRAVPERPLWHRGRNHRSVISRTQLRERPRWVRVARRGSGLFGCCQRRSGAQGPAHRGHSRRPRSERSRTRNSASRRDRTRSPRTAHRGCPRGGRSARSRTRKADIAQASWSMSRTSRMPRHASGRAFPVAEVGHRVAIGRIARDRRIDVSLRQLPHAFENLRAGSVALEDRPHPARVGTAGGLLRRSLEHRAVSPPVAAEDVSAISSGTLEVAPHPTSAHANAPLAAHRVFVHNLVG
jgi:hypothetical protein